MFLYDIGLLEDDTTYSQNKYTLGDNSAVNVTFSSGGLSNVKRLKVVMHGSGAVSSLTVEPEGAVPNPTSAPLQVSSGNGKSGCCYVL